MSVSFYAIASNLAGRFEPWNITPPSGERDIVLSTFALPQGIAQEPTVLIHPPGPDEIELRYHAASRGGTVNFPGRLYLYQIRDNARNVTLCLKWLDSLYAQVGETQVHLGLADSGVQYAVIRNMGIARTDYGGQSYDAVVWDNEVHIGEALTPTG